MLSIIKREGVYATIIDQTRTLLILKKSGPYQGLWDLPGGGIETGESHLDTLNREILEEIAMRFDSHQFIKTIEHKDIYKNSVSDYEFRHTAHIFSIKNLSRAPNVVPEETHSWHPLTNLRKEILSPIAFDALFCY